MNDDAPRATSVALPALLEDAARRSAAYLRSLERRPVRPDPDAVQRLARLDEPLPRGPTDPAGVLALLDELVSPATISRAVDSSTVATSRSPFTRSVEPVEVRSRITSAMPRCGASPAPCARAWRLPREM